MQYGESMKQYVLRRRRCWTLLVQMDQESHLSERHGSDMPLDLRGLTREERVVVQASIHNERDFDRVADALNIQHPRIHLRESQKRVKAKRQRRVQTWRQFKHSLVSRKGKGKHSEIGKSGASAYHASYTSAEDCDYDDDTIEPADAYQAHNDPVDHRK